MNEYSLAKVQLFINYLYDFGVKGTKKSFARVLE